jgi:hypothetical protein
VPALRQLGRQGLCIQHYVFDRALNKPLQRRFLQRHAALARQGPSGSASTQDPLLPLLEWTASSGCAAHDIHNGLKWGLARHMGEPTALTELYIARQALRNGYAALIDLVPMWLADRLNFVEEPLTSTLLQKVWAR